jgi:hypothetical protein
MINVIGVYKYKINDQIDIKKTKDKITSIIERYKIGHTNHEYDRALGNAAHYGKFPIKCKLYVGLSNQLVCIIKDSGDGFNYQEVIKKFNNNEKYYHYHGFGTRSYANNSYLITDWKNHGKTIVLFYLGELRSPTTPSLPLGKTPSKKR